MGRINQTVNHDKLMDRYYGQLEVYSTSAALKEPCGDEMAIYLDIKNNKIMDIKVSASGCVFTKICGVTMASLVDNKTIYEAMDLSAKDVLDNVASIPEDHIHCNILAVSVLYRAIALYLIET